MKDSRVKKYNHIHQSLLKEDSTDNTTKYLEKLNQIDPTLANNDIDNSSLLSNVNGLNHPKSNNETTLRDIINHLKTEEVRTDSLKTLEKEEKDIRIQENKKYNYKLVITLISCLVIAILIILIILK